MFQRQFSTMHALIRDHARSLSSELIFSTHFLKIKIKWHQEQNHFFKMFMRHTFVYNADLVFYNYLFMCFFIKKCLCILYRKIWKFHYARLLRNILRYARWESLPEIPLCTFIEDCTFIRELRATPHSPCSSRRCFGV